MKKFNSIPRIGRAENLFNTGHLVIQEKMDGANFRFARSEDVDVDSGFDSGLVYGSKNVEFHDRENLNGSFEHAVDFVENNVDLDVLDDFANETNDTLVFYGEAMHPHTVHYTTNIPSVLLFDIYHVEDALFCDPSFVETFVTELGLETVPYLERGIDATEFSIEDYEFESSRWYDEESEGPKTEGIVIKNPETSARAKYRTEEFTEVHGTAKQSNATAANRDDSTELALKFTTEARVTKKIFKLRDHGHDVEMQMMPILWERVFQDIINEEYETIFTGDWDINTADFRSAVASHTATILERHLQRPDDSVLNEPVP